MGVRLLSCEISNTCRLRPPQESRRWTSLPKMSLSIRWLRYRTSNPPSGRLVLRRVVLGKRRVWSVVLPFLRLTDTQISSLETPAYAPPASVGGDTLPRPTQQTSLPGSRYGFHFPSPVADSASSRGNPTVLSASRSTSTVSSSFQGSAPPSRDCSPAPMSQGSGSAAPVSWGRAPTTPVPTSSVPLRASQMVQRAHMSQSRSLSRTFSVHDLNVTSRPRDFSIPVPPPYDYHADEDGLTIDEISPDEDDRMAEAALCTPGIMHTLFVKFSTNNTLKTLHLMVQIFAPRNSVLQHWNQVHIFSYQFPYQHSFQKNTINHKMNKTPSWMLLTLPTLK